MRFLLTSLLVLPLTTLAAAANDAPPVPADSIQSLFDCIPELPSSAEEAASWIDRSGNLVHAGLLSLKADIETHQRAMEQIAKAHGEQARAQGAVMTENMEKGLANVGIDMERAQRDPAYAREIQERMKQMSPAELVAMSKKMAEPMNQDPRLQNQAQAEANDPAPVRAAAEAGFVYSDGQAKRLQRYQAESAETEQAVKKALAAKPLSAGPKPATPYDSIGCDRACQSEWDAYAARVLPLLLARETEALQIRRAALQRHRTSIAADIRTADRHLLASGYGANAQGQVNQRRIQSYDNAAIGELLYLIDRMQQALRSAAVVPHCGKQVVIAPGTVCN